jgi:hypothetical protein
MFNPTQTTTDDLFPPDDFELVAVGWVNGFDLGAPALEEAS